MFTDVPLAIGRYRSVDLIIGRDFCLPFRRTVISVFRVLLSYHMEVIDKHQYNFSIPICSVVTYVYRFLNTDDYKRKKWTEQLLTATNMQISMGFPANKPGFIDFGNFAQPYQGRWGGLPILGIFLS